MKISNVMNLGKFKFLTLTIPSFFIVFLMFGFTNFVFAASPSSVAMSVAPENPAPGENVTISLSSYLNNLDSVMITWLVNGTHVLSGIGKKSFSLTAPAAGAETSVRVQIALPEGSVENSVVIKPNSMVLLWQATDSYVPPFYKGKAMPTADSEIKIVALPEVKNTSAKNMAYSWKKDYTADQGASGYGKNAYTYVNDYLENSNTISVVASTINGASSESSINVNAVVPQIVFYKQEPELGTIWEQALQDGHRIQGEEILVAIPYFVSPKNLQHPSLVWTWSINNNTVATQSVLRYLFPVRAKEGTSGISTIGLQIENRDRIFQSASNQLTVQF